MRVGPLQDKSDDIAQLMRAANAGDEGAYKRALALLAPRLRAIVGNGFRAYGYGTDDVEDVVQETLLTIHLKRQTWDESQPLSPWLRAIARNKLIDHLRRRGHRQYVPIEDFENILEAPSETGQAAASLDGRNLLDGLKPRERSIVEAISIEGRSSREVAEKLEMTEGAVRVALHRALKTLAARYRSE
ncbi:MAG: sigma-70 family RNA polymerase sigma factor [Hyphomicrobiaceae bacterium]|nr:sigma-70 family RNA polymerase sigma factor [Hyphomicrobiaceae bacterium]